jgi:hypothetical protein
VSLNQEADSGLPPVTPPSGKFIIQLFLVPGLIVAGVVGVLYLVAWLSGLSSTPEGFLRKLRDSNSEVRWRGAHELAQVLAKDEKLATKPAFALDLADLLRQALRENEQLAVSHSQTDSGTGSEAKTLQDQRAFVQFLMNCLGNCRLPVGVALLGEIAQKEDGGDAATVALRRQVAVWALANLGQNLKSLAALSPEQRTAIEAELEQECAVAAPERRQWAQLTHDYLRNLSAKGPQALGVDRVLAQCARASDPELRKFVALALNFWEGTPEENARMEDTLLKLSYDDGHGATSDTAVRGLEVRYNATEGLARRGSAKIKSRLGVLGEMLDEDQQEHNFRTKLSDGRDATDNAAVYSTVTGALKALASLHHKQPNLDLTTLTPAVDRLQQSNNAAFKAEAKRTRIALDTQ